MKKSIKTVIETTASEKLQKEIEEELLIEVTTEEAKAAINENTKRND